MSPDSHVFNYRKQVNDNNTLNHPQHLCYIYMVRQLGVTFNYADMLSISRTYVRTHNIRQ